MMKIRLKNVVLIMLCSLAYFPAPTSFAAPAKADLTITSMHADGVAARPCPKGVTPTCTLLVTLLQSGTITVKNNSTTITALGVSRTSPATLPIGASQTTTCGNLPPGGSCTFTFSTTGATIGFITVEIAGTNTTTVAFILELS